MTQALVFGAVSGLSLVLGAGLGLIGRWPHKAIAAVLAFGSGVLICALTFGLMEEAYLHGGFPPVIFGFLAGGLLFILGDYLLHLAGGRAHKRRILFQPKAAPNGSVITFGTVLDGIPESIALGAAVANSPGIGILLVVAISLANIPEALAAVPGLRREGFRTKGILALWCIVGLVTWLVTVASFSILRSVDPAFLGFIEAFSAGSILAMVANSMLPEAYEEGGLSVGVLTLLGFLLAFVLSRLS